MSILKNHAEKKLDYIKHLSFNIHGIYSVGNKLYFGDNGYMVILHDPFLCYVFNL